ncbi:Transcriptional activator of fatty acid utilization [Saxophila tyrrhenica]|uniref:Transcriptional activator of fatty acid utilization n=1 Tax=Saxophila tyrrhenica TaxID=1690608 RepID=A0AAV9P6H7_9PEZI|nr:Transcriptional activator of fatty acid utilization [Saxophila tyrrhenica]
MPPAGSPDSKFRGHPEETSYPSRSIAYQAAGMITSIIEALQNHDQLRYTPAFIVYSLFSALIMHVYQMRSSNQSVVAQTQQRTSICMNALRDVSRVWLVAKMVHTLFESILGNKALEERLQKAAGRRHAKSKGPNGFVQKPPTAQVSPVPEQNTTSNSESNKRKFDDMDNFGYVNGPPAPQMSYERSRPQSPVLTPQPNPPVSQPQQMPQLSAGSPNPTFRPTHDAFLGGPSRGNTRPTTPFNPWGGTRPSTPDFFLHTRASPKISDDLWQNYAPEQLFPSEINGAFSLQSPGQTMVDPALRGPPQHQQFTSNGMQQPDPTSMPGHQQMTMPQQDGNNINHQDGNMQHMMYNHQDWSQMDMGQRPDDTWSSSSHSGPIVPTTLNVGDWFEFFGIPNGDLSALAAAGGLGNPTGNGNGGYG